MPTYISILRGINVSGQKLIKMDVLKKMYEKLTFENIRIYVKSGNVIFSSNEKEPKKLEKIISTKIKTELGFDVPVIVLTVKALENIIQKNPFAKDALKDVSFLHVTFLADRPEHFNKEIIIEKCLSNEEIEFSPNAIYLYCPNGYGKTKLNNSYLEAKLNVTATTRNWKTTNELFKLATLI